MRSKALVVLFALAMIGGSSAAMARGGGGGGGGGGGHGHSGHGVHFNHFNHRLNNNAAFIGGWGWGGWGYNGSGYGNTNTTVVFPQAVPQTAEVTGSIRAAPCRWNEDTFNVPASAGGNKPITVVSCR